MVWRMLDTPGINIFPSRPMPFHERWCFKHHVCWWCGHLNILTDDGNLYDYLCMWIVHDGMKVTMYKPKITHHCLEVLSMPLPDNNSSKIKARGTPATNKLMLHTDSKSTERKCTKNYWVKNGVQNYLQTMRHPDITFAVNHCVRHC